MFYCVLFVAQRVNPLQAGYVALFVLAAAGCFFGAVRTRTLGEPEIGRPLRVFLAATGIWGVSGAALFVAPSLRVMSAVYTVGLVFGFGTVFAWLWFCSAYAGRGYHRDRRIQAAAAGVFLLVSSIKLTNPIHHAYFVPALADDPFVHFAPEAGAFYWVVTAVAYTGSAVGLYVLFELYFASRFNSLKIGLLTVAIALPVVPKLLAVVSDRSLLLMFYEPIGAAVFAVGVVSVATESFLSVRAPGRRQLVERLADPVLIVDSSERLVEYNERARELFPEVAGSLGDPLAGVAPSVTEAEHGDRIGIVRDGKTRYYLLNRSVITLGSAPIGRAIVLSDVTDLERQRDHLEQQTAHLENLTEAMAHELRNPLAIVRGNLELLGEEAGRPDPDLPGAVERGEPGGVSAAADTGGRAAPPGAGENDSIGTALAAVERMEGVVDDLISIMEYGTPITDTEPHPIGSIIDDAKGSFGGTVEVIGGRERPIVADRTRCGELFRHLFRLHDGRGASTVSVEVLEEGFAVGSDGERFLTSERGKLFEYGVETGENARIILANAWTLANLHGWSIEADPEADGPRIVVSGVSYADEGSGGPGETEG